MNEAVILRLRCSLRSDINGKSNEKKAGKNSYHLAIRNYWWPYNETQEAKLRADWEGRSTKMSMLWYLTKKDSDQQQYRVKR